MCPSLHFYIFYEAYLHDLFNLQICAVLYPGDTTESGKLLRLKQQFFLCSASLQVGKFSFIFISSFLLLAVVSAYLVLHKL